MAQIETWYNQDLQQPVKVHYLDGSLFSHNSNGNRIGVHVFNNGEPVTLSGTVSGYVVTADGSTVPCTGTRSGNSASILIPAAAYQPGAVFITLFITDGTTVTTLASVSTSVLTARTNNQIDPGSVVTDWTQTVNAAMQSVETAAENLGGIIAVPYANITYPVPLGKYTYYEGNLYRCISPIATSESFTAAHWTQVRLGDDVSDLKSAMNWIGQGKNLCGLDPDVYYPVCLDDGEYLTMSTADGSNCGYSGMYLYVYDANKTQLNYYSFPSDASQRTIKLSTDYKARFLRWSRDIHKNMQVEIGETKTAYEPYWGNAFSLSTALNSVISDVNAPYGAYNLVKTIEDNKYLQNTTGRVFDNDAYRASDYIEIVPNAVYKLGLFNSENAPSFENNAITVCFYDAVTTVIADTYVYASGYSCTRCEWDGGFIKFTSPANAHFLKMGTNDSDAPLKWFVASYDAPDLYASYDEIKTQIVTNNTALQGKRIAVFGDSIMGNTRDVTSTPAFISKSCGATVFNFGFGGCRMSVHASGWDNCSMYRLADDIYNNDFTSLVSAINTGWSGMPGYYRNTVAWLSACDFSKVDAIIIAYGTNDYREPTSVLDNQNNKFDTSTVCGALRYSIKQILSKYPGVQILVTCPIFRTFFQDDTTTPEEYSDTKDWGSGTLLQYEEAYKQACADMNVPFLDLYHETSFNPYTRLYFYPADDGTHPNEKGRERIGNIIGGRIKTLLPSN